MWHLMGSETGRVTTTEPALHSTVYSTPRDPKARSIIVPSDTTKVFVVADFQAAELRIQAFIGPEPTMLKVIREKKDLHMPLRFTEATASKNNMKT